MPRNPTGLTRRQLLKIGIGFTIAFLVLYSLGRVIGWPHILRLLHTAHLPWVALAGITSLLGLIAWAKAWHCILRTLDITFPFPRLIITYFAATFANYITPFGQAGGEPIIAYVLAQDTDASYEDSLASVVTTDLLNLLPFFTFAAIGAAYLTLNTTLPSTATLLIAALGAIAVLIPILVLVGWVYRTHVTRAILYLITPLIRHTSLTKSDITTRITQFYTALEQISTHPRTLLVTLCFAYLGWLGFTLPLYFVAHALNTPLALISVLFIVPAGSIASLVPLPGGTGSIELVLVALLIALASLTPATATAIALLYRLTCYWLTLTVGGACALIVTARV